MSKTKVSILVLSGVLFTNMNPCFSARKTERTVRRGKVAYGTLITPNMPTITPENPGEIPIIPPSEGDNSTTPDEGGNEDTNLPNEDEIANIERNERILAIKRKYQERLNNAQLNCIGIGDTLKMIQNLSIATTTTSGLGALTSGGALASELIGEGEERQGLETGLLVGAAATSGSSTITSAISLSKMEDLISKMKKCNENIKEISVIKTELTEEEVPLNDKIIQQIDAINSSCKEYDINNMESVKAQLWGSTIASGVGTASSVAGVITNAKNSDGENDKLDLATKITTGISTATSATGVVLNSITISGVNKDKEKADNCETILMKF